jgi:uncharacterized protein
MHSAPVSKARTRSAWLLLSVLVCTLATSFVSAVATSVASALDVPKLERRVNDYAGLLSANDVATLESKLATYEQSTGHQFALLVIPNLDGNPI